MSFSDSETSSHGGEYKNFRQTTRDRLLYEMLQDSKAGSSWKVLIMDRVTLKVMSHSCKMADITDQGISLVEDLFKRREPMPSMDAIYFIQPSKENMVMFLSDMSGREPLYRKAYVYFCSSVSKDLISRIKNDCSVLPRIGALREMNLEYFPIDSQAFISDHEKALEELFGENAAKNSRSFDMCMNGMATRISTVFASLKEFPFVRYKAARSPDDGTGPSDRDLIPSKLAAAIWNNITTYKTSIPNFPQTETCELLIVDRSIDQIAPIIHEWTYDAMCHDLLELEGNKYVQEVPSKTGGPPEQKEVLLEDSDPVWLELRHSHIAEASERLHEKMTNLVSKNKAAQFQRDGSEVSTRDLQKMVQALPKYNEQMDKLSVHVQIAGKINEIIRDVGLRDLGQLEQDLVFGDAGSKEVITYLRANQDSSSENKLRLLMIYAVVYPDKFEGDKAIKLMQLAKLTRADIATVRNMKFLEPTHSKKSSRAGFSLKFDSSAKKKQAEREDRTADEEESWALFRFYPKLEELIEKLGKGELPKDEYDCMNTSNPSKQGTQGSSGASQASSGRPGNVKSRRTANWARSRTSDDGYSSDSVLKSATTDFKRMGQRIFIFIIGGATRSELRVCHKLTAKLRREVVLGTTSLDDPPEHIAKLKLLSTKELSMENINT